MSWRQYQGSEGFVKCEHCGRSDEVSEEEIELVEEAGETLVGSYDSHVPDHKQPTEWHEGKTLVALAAKLRSVLQKREG